MQIILQMAVEQRFSKLYNIHFCVLFFSYSNLLPRLDILQRAEDFAVYALASTIGLIYLLPLLRARSALPFVCLFCLHPLRVHIYWRPILSWQYDDRCCIRVDPNLFRHQLLSGSSSGHS